MALGVVRALGEAGVPVVVAHYDRRDMAHVSRHAREAVAVPPPHSHEDDFVEALVALAARLGGSLLVPASDEAVVALSRNRARLARHYVVAAPAWDVVRTFIEKRRTYEVAEAAGVPAPATAVPRSLEEARSAAARIGFPLLLKPSQSHLFYERFRRKMVVVPSMRELTARFGEAQAAGLEVLVQEIVPGPDTEVVNYNAYFWEGRPLVEFTARQIRKAPPHFGSPRVVRSERVEGVLGPGRAMLRAIGLDGFACSEFKRDPRDGRYKIVDVNGRHNLSGLLAVRCGVNFPLLQYRHLVHGELPRPTPFRDGVYWTDVVRDLGYGLRFPLEDHQAPWTYLAPYFRPHCDAIFDRTDLGPFLTRCGTLLRAALHLPRHGAEAPAASWPTPERGGPRTVPRH
jgi:predicted ATP-grasp superfamily ATP-dependent carboligase